MKIQDIVFLLVFIFLIFKHYNWSISAALISIAISIPLFALRIFFTAQHLVWYSAAFLILAIIKMIIKEKRTK